MADLMAMLRAAEVTIDGILDSSGCTVALRRPTDPMKAAVDPATLTVTAPPADFYAVDVPAIVVEVPAGSDGKPARPAVGPGARIAVKDGAADVRTRDEVVVTRSDADRGMIGREYAVTRIGRSTAGIVMLLDAGPVRRP